MKKTFIIIAILIILPLISAVNLQVEKTSSDEVMILDLGTPVIFNLDVTNNGDGDELKFYTFFGILEDPANKVSIEHGQTKSVQVKILPSYTLKTGFSSFDLHIRGSDSSEITKRLMVKVVNLQDAFEISSEAIDIEADSINVKIKNKINYNFENVHAKFYSPFFEFEKDFHLGAKDEKTFEVKLNRDDFKKVQAGFYTLQTEINIENITTNIEGTIQFIEKNIVTSSEKQFGFIINTQTIEKVNKGNTVESSETVIKKNIISRLFTNFNPNPDEVQRKGAVIYYTWSRNVNPGETLKIVVRTNWFFPLIIILLIVGIVIIVKKYSSKDLSLRKKVHFVRAKGGEFALKVSISVHAKRYVEKVNIIDRLPALVKLYERFGGDQPVRTDEKTRRIEWQFEKLEEGEIRILSYVIYSKVGVLGKFALPSASGVYEREGEIREVQSNKAFFMAEQKSRE